MRKLALIVALMVPSAARAQFCVPYCVSNQTPLQSGAVFHVSSGTVSGQLTAGTLVLTGGMTLNAPVTATGFAGPGSALTSLNASQLASGTVTSARVSGAYPGITGVGAIASGTWNGAVIGSGFGGTGANLSTANPGAIPYFNQVGTMTALPPPSFLGVLESTGTGGAPVWVSSPAIQGYNFLDVPLTALLPGNLPQTIAVNDASISTVSASKVVGDIAGNAAGVSGTLALSKLGSGTLATSVVASSITAPSPGVLRGVYADASHIPQLTIGTDGRISTVTLMGLSVPLSDLQSGTLGGGILVPAASVQAGSLGSQVVASSVADSGVAPGIYGGPALIPQVTVGRDGRVTSASNISIQGIVAGTGSVGQDAVWISTWQVGSGLLLEKVGNVYLSTGTALYAYGPGGYVVGQSSIATSGGFFGDGAGLTDLTPANVASGLLPPTVIVSSVAANAVGDPQLTVTGVTAAAKGSSSRVPTVTVNAQGRVTALSDQTVAISTGEWVGVAQANRGGTGNDWSAVAAGGLPYFSGTGALGVLAKSVNGYALTQSAGAPAWAATVSSATNLAGGAAGSLPYQSAANATALLPASVNGYALQQAAGVPAWVAAVSSATNVAGGAANSIPYQSAANTTAMLAGGTGVLQESAGSPAWTTTPGITGMAAQTQALNMGTHQVNNVVDPTSAQDAATKNYVDSLVNGIQWKKSVRLATTGALPANTYNNGTSGVGATLTGNSVGTLTIDGATPNSGDRILVKDETTQANDGIYTLTQNGAGIAYVLTRSVDYDSIGDMDAGTAVWIDSGTANSDTGWVQTSPIGTVGTDKLAFVQFTALGQVTAGSGLIKAGSTLSVDSSSVAVKSNGLVRDSEIDGSSVTKQGNSFNAASQLVLLDASAHVPSSVGVQAGSILAGTVGAGVLLPVGNLSGSPIASSVLPSTVAYTTSANTFGAASGNTFTYGVSVGSITASNYVSASSATFATVSASTMTALNWLDTKNNIGNSGTSLTVDWSQATVSSMTLTGNVTLTFSHVNPGQSMTFLLKQDATGSRTVTWPTIKWPAGTAPTLTTTAGKTDIISVYYSGTDYYGFTGGLNY